jgi:hypothetical protein
MSLAARYPKSVRVLKEVAFYAGILGAVFVLYAWVLPRVGFET